MKALVRLLPVLAMLLVGCANTPTTGTSNGLQTFDTVYKAALTADDILVTTATSALNAGVITSDQALKVQSITVAVKTVLDAAMTAYTAGNSLAANQNVGVAASTVVGVSLCLTMKPLTIVKFGTCIQTILPPVVTP